VAGSPPLQKKDWLPIAIITSPLCAPFVVPAMIKTTKMGNIKK
jgi:hypothetical protein